MKKRLFLAINLPEEIRGEIATIIQNLKKENSKSSVKWIEKKNLHVTLHFLGNIEEEKVSTIVTVMEHIVGKYCQVTLSLIESVDGFPKLEKATVLFVPVFKNKDIYSLQNELGEALKSLEVDIPDKDFHMHITIGRNKGNGKISLVPVNFKKLEFPVESISLMESKLTGNGSIYSIVKKFKLQGS